MNYKFNMILKMKKFFTEEGKESDDFTKTEGNLQKKMREMS